MTLLTAIAAIALLAQAPTPGTPPANPAAGQSSPDDSRRQDPGTEALRLQVTLDRAGFSPGLIDGRMGANTGKAAAQYRQQKGAEPVPDVNPLMVYTITAEDAAGPFVPSIPSDLVEQAALPALGYTSLVEALAERFHAAPDLLRRLNPTARFAEGEQIQVPNVEPLVAPVAQQASAPEAQPAGTAGSGGAAKDAAVNQPNPVARRPPVVVTVSKGSSALRVEDSSGRTIFYAPVTTGSEHDPLPIGEWKVNGVQFNPIFHYNPDLFWDADPSHSKAKIPGGPNNPVGLVWIDLSKDHYGIHGTSEPSTIGRAQSHGCVRLTNWDAVRLAAIVQPGTRVVFAE
jgi:lipoprotein-anchoring transpeptidase ErfK/SrfK